MVRVHERIDGQILALNYSALYEHHDALPVLRLLAEKARRRCGYELDQRRPSEPYDYAKIQRHVERNWTPFLPTMEVEAVNAWGDEMKMQLAPSRIALSPVAYRDLRKRPADPKPFVDFTAFDA